MIRHETPFQGDDLERAARESLAEYRMNIQGVVDSYDSFLYRLHVDPSQVENTIEDLKRMIQVKINSPRRPPRLIILGPPGSGRATQARSLSKRYGLVHVSTMQLLRDEISKRTEEGTIISNAINKGELVPDDTILNIIERRLGRTDCKVNGWVMDGFPKTVAQVKLLKQLKIRPSKVILLECSEDVSVQRLQARKYDPLTGFYYNESNLPEDQDVVERLKSHDEDTEEVVRKRWKVWDNFIGKIEEIYDKNIFNVNTEAHCTEEITDIISEVVQNPALG